MLTPLISTGIDKGLSGAGPSLPQPWARVARVILTDVSMAPNMRSVGFDHARVCDRQESATWMGPFRTPAAWGSIMAVLGRVRAALLEDWLRDRYFDARIDISSSGVQPY